MSRRWCGGESGGEEEEEEEERRVKKRAGHQYPSPSGKTQLTFWFSYLVPHRFTHSLTALTNLDRHLFDAGIHRVLEQLRHITHI